MIDCHKCLHYYVTWDKNFPHGCKAMGFKSKQLPSLSVLKSTPNIDCLAFEPKVIRKSHKNNSK